MNFKMKLLEPYRDEQTIKNVILDLAQRERQVVYGQQSVNIQVPPYLMRTTKDYDIYTKKPKESAEKLADSLNKEYGEEKFKVIEGKHKGTFKVKSGEDTIADYTLARKKPKSSRILGIAYANLEYQKKKLKMILKDKALEYRHEKDRDTLSKINEAEIQEFIIS